LLFVDSSRTVLLSFLLPLAVLTACGADDSGREASAQASSDSTPSVTDPLTVFSGRGAVLVAPLMEMFEEQTGIPVEVRYEKSTQALANRIATEGEQGDADVFFAQDSGWLGALAEAGHLAPLPSDMLSRVPAAYRDPTGKWIGVSGRARVLVYSPDRFPVEKLPKTLAGLPFAVEPGRVGWAPGNASFQAHVSALRDLWGEEETRAWLTAMQAAEPKVYPKNSPQVQGVSNGEIDVGWVNHYYLHKLRAADPGLQAANYSFRTPGDPGNLMMLSGVGRVAYSDQGPAAEAFIDFLLSPAAQAYFATETFEYPTVSGIALHPDVPPLDEELVRADQVSLTDLSGTIVLLRELGLQ